MTSLYPTCICQLPLIHTDAIALNGCKELNWKAQTKVSASGYCTAPYGNAAFTHVKADLLLAQSRIMLSHREHVDCIVLDNVGEAVMDIYPPFKSLYSNHLFCGERWMMR